MAPTTRPPLAQEPTRQMRTITDNSTPSDLKISVFFPDVLKRIWEEGKRDWSVYMQKQQFTYSWDFREVEHRK